MTLEKAKPQELAATRIASAVSVVLALFKLIAGISTGSLSLFASAMDSLFDAISSFMGYLLLRMSLEPADKEHPYGHSRIESIASLGQGGILFTISLGLIYSASQRMDHHHEPQNLDATLYVPLAATLITLGLWIYLGKVARNTRSPIIAGDRLHYFSDLAGNIFLLVGFVISRVWHLYNVDALLTIILSLFMFSGAMKIASNSIKELVDHNDIEAEEEIEKIVAQFYPEALGIKKIRSRRSGRRLSVDIELLTCRQKKFQNVHDISHDVQQRILEAMPHADIVIHSEPCETDLCQTDSRCRLENVTRKP